jgi:hypothetical protein
LKKGGWITHLSGRILKPSLHESFVEKYTDSLVDIPASHSVQQASDKEKKTQDTYGHTSSSTSGQLDLFGAFGKMSQDTPRWGYGESCPIWKKKVIERRSAYSVRKKLAHHTKGNESSSLQNYPTPAARDYKGTNSKEHVLHKSKGFKGHMNQLPNFIKYGMQNWATPVAMNDGIYVDNSPNKDKRHSQGLATQASQNWATPQASDHIEGARTAKESNQKCLGRDLNQMNWPTPRAGNPGSRKPGTGGKILAEEAKIHNGLQDQEKSNTSGKNQGSPKLNPSWVEQLMGLSTGWTDLGCWGMELSPKPQN